MLEKDGFPHFGDIGEAGAAKYLLHIEGHDYWSMRIRQFARTPFTAAPACAFPHTQRRAVDWDSLILTPVRS